jgi:hypothetical protein
MNRPRTFSQGGLDAHLSRILQGAVIGAEPPSEGRHQLLHSASRLARGRAWEREVLYYRAREWISLRGEGAPRFGWMTLPLEQNYLLGFPKPRFSW